MERLALMIYQTNLIFDQIQNQENKHLAYHHALSVMKEAKAIMQIHQIHDDCILIAAYMHDCALYQYHGKNHAHKSASIAHELLVQSNRFHAQEIERITQMIAHHSDKHSLHHECDEIIKNADLLAKYKDHEWIEDAFMQRIKRYL